MTARKLNENISTIQLIPASSHLKVELAFVLSTLSWSIDLSLSSPRLPVDLRVNILNIIDLKILLHSSARVDQEALVEWFSLIIPVSVLSSNNVSVSVLLSLPGGLVEQLGVGLEATGDGARSIGLIEGIIELNLSHGHLRVSVWLSSVIWLQVGFSERSAPLFIECLVRGKHGGLSITSEEVGPCFIKIALISHETKK